MKQVKDLDLQVGWKIKLHNMPFDPDPIEVGTTGTVISVNGKPNDWYYQVNVKWDKEPISGLENRSLMLCGIDEVEIIEWTTTSP